MSETASLRRLAENEVVFRNANEKIRKLIVDSFPPTATREPRLYFYCECSNEDCKDRIVMTPSKYKELHKNSAQFILIPGHEHTAIERYVKRTPKWIVVEKYLTPPQNVTQLKPTK